MPEIVKVFNLVKALHDLVAEEGPRQPFLIPIGERAERVREAFENQQIHTQEALEEFTRLTREAQEAELEWERSGLSREAFAVFWFLRGKGVPQPETVATETARAFEEHPYWRSDPKGESDVRLALYKSLFSVGVKEGATEMVSQLLAGLRRA